MRLTVTRIAVKTTNSSAAKCRKLIPTIHDHTLPAGRCVLPSSRPKRPAPSTNPVHSAARAPVPFSRLLIMPKRKHAAIGGAM